MKLAVIGTGQMGQALIRRLLETGEFSAKQVWIYDVRQDLAAALASELGVHCLASAAEAAADADFILLAVKPQVMPLVIRDLAPVITEKQVVMSIAAGLTLQQIRGWGLEKPALIRIMPNLPAVIGEGVSALAFDRTEPEQAEKALRMFETCGLAVVVDESLMDAVTGLSGSGPAYAMLMIEALADGAVVQGLSRDDALKMAAMTLRGAAGLVLKEERHPAVVKDEVSSPGGTTAAALRVLEEKGLRSALIEAVAAAARRSRQLRETTDNHG